MPLPTPTVAEVLITHLPDIQAGVRFALKRSKRTDWVDLADELDSEVVIKLLKRGKRILSRYESGKGTLNGYLRGVAYWTARRRLASPRFNALANQTNDAVLHEAADVEPVSIAAFQHAMLDLLSPLDDGQKRLVQLRYGLPPVENACSPKEISNILRSRAEKSVALFDRLW